MQIKSKDPGRPWMWAFLAVIVLAQFYVVHELVAAFALFAIGFAAFIFVVASLHMLVKCRRSPCRPSPPRYEHGLRQQHGQRQPREPESGLSRDELSARSFARKILCRPPIA